MRKMIKMKRREGEEWGKWLQRSAKRCHAARKAAGLPAWSHIFLQRHHAWMGHVARSCSWAPSPAEMVLSWRSLPWWRERQLLAPRGENRTEALHRSRKCWLDSVELRLEEAAGMTWRTAAASKTAWRASSRAFVRWFQPKWNLPCLPGSF